MLQFLFLRALGSERRIAESNLNIMYIGWVDRRFWQGLFELEEVEIEVTNSEGRDTGGFSAPQEKVDLPELRYGAGCGMAPGTSATEVPRPSFSVLCY